MKQLSLFAFAMVMLSSIIAQDSFERLYTTENTTVHTTSLALVNDSYLLLGVELDPEDNRYTKIHVLSLTNKGDINWSNTYTYRDTLRIKQLGDIAADEFGNIVFTAELEKDSLSKMITALDPSGNILWSKVTGAITDVRTVFTHKPGVLIPYFSKVLMSSQTGSESPDILLSAMTEMGELIWQNRMQLNNNTVEQVNDMIFTIDSVYALLGSTSDPDRPLFLTKLDTTGEVIWSFSYKEPFRSIIPTGLKLHQTKDSSYVITGTLAADGGIPEEAFMLHLNEDGSLRKARSLKSANPAVQIAHIGSIVLDTSFAVLGMSYKDNSMGKPLGLVISYDLDSSFGYQTLLDSISEITPYLGGIVTPDSASVAILTTAPYANNLQIPYLAKLDRNGRTLCEESVFIMAVDSIGFEVAELSWTLNATEDLDSIISESQIFSGYTPPTLSLADTTYCPQDPIRYVVDATTRGAVRYRWDDGNMDSIRLFTEEGMYMLTVTIGEDLCYELCDTLTISVRDLPATEILPNFGLVCETGEIFLVAETQGAIETFSWSTGEQTRVISVITPGTYRVTVTDICGNSENASYSLSQSDFQREIPIPLIVTDEDVCENGTIAITAQVENAQGLMWSTGARDVIRVAVSAPGQVTVTRANQFCNERGAVLITEGQFVPPLSATLERSCDPGVRFTLSVTGTGIFARLWDTGATGANISVTEPGNYRVTVTDGCGITSVLNTDVSREDLNDCIPPPPGQDCLRWPNAFLPEGDNVNNKTFGPENDCPNISSYELHIFNRWGQEVFVSNSVTNRWDGQKDGNFFPSDVYFYWARYTSGDDEFKAEGDITLIR